jgi:hypothetical protein
MSRAAKGLGTARQPAKHFAAQGAGAELMAAAHFFCSLGAANAAWD